MLFVFNKDKITSYFVALSTVIILFVMSIISNKEITVQTSTNIENNVELNELKENKNL